jgi:hypothetical protein
MLEKIAEKTDRARIITKAENAEFQRLMASNIAARSRQHFQA